MAAKLLSLYLLAVAGLAIVRAAPLVLDQRQDNPNGTFAIVPDSQIHGPVFNASGEFNVTSRGVPFKRAAPLILDQRQDDQNGVLEPSPTKVIGPTPG